MRVHPTTAASDPSPSLVDSFSVQRLEEVSALPEVLTHLAALQASHPEHGVFCTLEGDR